MPLIDSLSGQLSDRPGEAMRILRALLFGPNNNWQFAARGDAIWTLLEQALHSGDPAAQEIGREIINGLGARGLFVFRELFHAPGA